MFKPTDREYILSSQYKDSSALSARIQIHRFSINKQGMWGWVFDHVKLPEHCDILELGCGSGGMWQSRASLIKDGWRMTLTDISPGMLKETRKNLSEIPYSFDFAVVDAQDIPFDDQTFDAVFANHMLYHVPDRRKALGEIRRVLKHGGTLYASTIGFGHMEELQTLCSRIDSRIDLGLDNVQHEFGLENGAEQLNAFFDDVRLYLYDDSLLVPEAKPLVDYLLSSSDRLGLLSDYGPDALMKAIEDELEQSGSIRITKKTGLFTASLM